MELHAGVRLNQREIIGLALKAYVDTLENRQQELASENPA